MKIKNINGVRCDHDHIKGVVIEIANKKFSLMEREGKLLIKKRNGKRIQISPEEDFGIIIK